MLSGYTLYVGTWVEDLSDSVGKRTIQTNVIELKNKAH